MARKKKEPKQPTTEELLKQTLKELGETKGLVDTLTHQAARVTQEKLRVEDHLAFMERQAFDASQSLQHAAMMRNALCMSLVNERNDLLTRIQRIDMRLVALEHSPLPDPQTITRV